MCSNRILSISTSCLRPEILDDINLLTKEIGRRLLILSIDSRYIIDIQCTNLCKCTSLWNIYDDISMIITTRLETNSLTSNILSIRLKCDNIIDLFSTSIAEEVDRCIKILRIFKQALNTISLIKLINLIKDEGLNAVIIYITNSNDRTILITRTRINLSFIIIIRCCRIFTSGSELTILRINLRINQLNNIRCYRLRYSLRIIEILSNLSRIINNRCRIILINNPLISIRILDLVVTSNLCNGLICSQILNVRNTNRTDCTSIRINRMNNIKRRISILINEEYSTRIDY